MINLQIKTKALLNTVMILEIEKFFTLEYQHKCINQRFWKSFLWKTIFKTLSTIYKRSKFLKIFPLTYTKFEVFDSNSSGQRFQKYYYWITLFQDLFTDIKHSTENKNFSSTYHVSGLISGFWCYSSSWGCRIIMIIKICDLQIKTFPMMYNM